MSHRILRSPQVELDGRSLAPHADDVFHVWSTGAGELLSYRGPDESAVRRALRGAAVPFTLALRGAEERLEVAAAPVGPQDCTPGQTLIFRIER